MTFGKRQLVIGALVAALGAAVYLNWQFADTQSVTVGETSSISSEKKLGQTTYVNTEITGEQASSDNVSENKESGENSADEQNSSKSSDKNADSEDLNDVPADASLDNGLTQQQKRYFENERERRNKAHEDALSTLEDILESADSSDSAKKSAAEAAERLSGTIKAEGDIEGAVVSKGFYECLASINNDSCNIIVAGEKLEDAAVISIKDIVNRQGGIDFEKITITQI